MARYYSYIDNSVGIGSTTINDMIANGSEYGVVPSLDIVARNIEAESISGKINPAAGGFAVVGVITATSFDGNLSGNVTGSLNGNVTGNVTGNVNGNVTGDSRGLVLRSPNGTSYRVTVSDSGSLTTTEG